MNEVLITTTMGVYTKINQIFFISLGTFNGWQKLRMSRSHKDFVAMIELGKDYSIILTADSNYENRNEQRFCKFLSRHKFLGLKELP